MKKWLGVVFIFLTTFSIHPFVSFGQTKPPENSRVDITEPGKNSVKEKAVYEEFEEFIRIVNEIQGKYVDGVTLNTILTNAYRGMLSGLDPYSQYFGAEELEDLKIETEGEFEGLGIEVVMKDGFLVVITPMLDSPAFKGGILVGDKIIKIDGASAENMNIREVIKRLRGKAGVKITLTVVHEGEATPVNITLERATIHVNSTRGARIVDDTYKIGYIAIINFQENTVKDMDAAIQGLLKQGMRGLILDLRFNPGGLLNVAIDMADKFLEKGVIVSTRGRDKTQNYVYRARKKDTYPNFPLIVLVNNGSASASEIVAGAIKDHKRGVLLGIKTYGKGSVQSLIPVGGDKAALKLTTARYYTPSGVCIHEKGIEPDINVPLNFPETKSLHEHLSTISIDSKTDSANTEASPSTKTTIAGKEKARYVDVQIERAIDVMKGIEVYTTKAQTR